jgi:hypothetical protein
MLVAVKALDAVLLGDLCGLILVPADERDDFAVSGVPEAGQHCGL